MASQGQCPCGDAKGTSPALLSPWELWRDVVGVLSPGRTLSPGTCRPPSACRPPATCRPLRHTLSLPIAALSGTRCPQNTSCPSGHVQLPPPHPRHALSLRTPAAPRDALRLTAPAVPRCAVPAGSSCPSASLLSPSLSLPRHTFLQMHAVPPGTRCPSLSPWMSPVPHPSEPAAGACPGPCRALGAANKPCCTQTLPEGPWGQNKEDPSPSSQPSPLRQPLASGAVRGGRSTPSTTALWGWGAAASPRCPRRRLLAVSIEILAELHHLFIAGPFLFQLRARRQQ